MKKLSCFLLLLLTLAACQGQPQTPRTSLLWKISGNGLPAPSYLFGTMHVMCAEDKTLTDKLKSRLDETGQLLLEVDLDDPSTLVTMMMGMGMKDKQSLDQLLSPAEYDSVARVFSKLSDLPFAAMKNTKPLLLMSVAVPALLGCEVIQPENLFMQYVRGQGKEVRGLEKVDDQLALFDSIPYRVQARLLADMMLNLDSSRRSLLNMLHLYRRGDIDSLALLMAQDPSFKGYDEVLLLARNRKWIPALEARLREKPSFIAVGAAHLPGEEGVINLLRRKGFVVEPVKL